MIDKWIWQKYVKYHKICIYDGNPYRASYGISPVQASAEGFSQYRSGPGSWGTYDMQQAQGHR